jgi:TolB-like protein/class 3 adenylate cyclase
MAEAQSQRRLAAIMAADVVGYSRLMELDESDTLDRLKTLRREVFSPTTARFGGRIFKLTGDGAFAEFGSAVDAVNSAIAIQRTLAERNAALPEGQRIELRIGISLGDVIVEGSDLYGNGVNVAARLEALAEPGGVYISSTVYDQATGKLAASFEDMGEHTVKNITKPVRVYRASDEPKIVKGSEPQSADTPPRLSDEPSIAVLPFDNLSDDPQQEYFSDGLAEDLITDLSKISSLSVAARNSSFSFKGQMPDVKDVADKLGVTFVLEGSVRKMGDRLRINAQLINGADGRHIWAERYDGDMEDIFEFQDNIREQIVSALRVSLTPTDKALTERKPTDSVEAYDLYLRGRALYYRYTPKDLLEAIKCFEEAIEIDPDFADAYGYLSYCHFQGWSQVYPGFDGTLDRANELAEKGVALDGTSAIALARLGWIQTFLRRFDPAVANLEKAIALAPNNADVIATFAQVLNYCGDPVRGLQLMEKAFSIDTFAPPNWEWQRCLSHFLLRQYDQAIASSNRAGPKFPFAYIILASTYVELDRLDDARDATKTLSEVAPQFTVNWIAKMLPFRLDEASNRIVEGLRKAGLPEE